MKNKIYIAIIAIILIATAVIFMSMSKSANKDKQSKKSGNNAQQTNISDTTKTIPQDAVNGSIQDIESSLNSVNESDFSMDKLSDQNVGL